MKLTQAAFLLFVITPLAHAATIPMEISRNCARPYEELERYWDTQRTLQTWAGMKELMSPCEEDASQAAKSIEIVVDKAGLDEGNGAPTPGGVSTVTTRLLRPLMSKQKMYVTAELLNGKKLKWKFLVSTGNDLSDGPDKPKPLNETPAGTFHLGRANDGLSGSQHIKNSQAYCVQGQQYSYIGTPMPYAIFFKSGYAIHSGVVTGLPESHGCVRADPQNARKLYCLLRQKTALGEPAKNRTNVAENYKVAMLRICEDQRKGCDDNGKGIK